MEEKQPSGISRAALIFSNLLPVVGVLFLGWSGFEVLMLYWMESVIICIFSYIKFFYASANQVQRSDEEDQRGLPLQVVISAVVYGTFLFGQYVAIIIFGIFAFELDHFDLKGGFFGPVFSDPSIGIGVFSFIISYTISFRRDFVGNSAFRNSAPGDFLFAPVKRIMIVQFAVIGGGAIAVFVSRLVHFDENILKGIMVGTLIVVKNLAEYKSNSVKRIEQTSNE